MKGKVVFRCVINGRQKWRERGTSLKRKEYVLRVSERVRHVEKGESLFCFIKIEDWKIKES